MTSRKRSSETAVISAGKSDMEVGGGMDEPMSSKIVDGGSSSNNIDSTSKTRLRVRIRRYHGVAKWTWNVGRGEEDEVCGICQSEFEGTPPGIKFPGDEAPVVFGVCGHAFHLQCVAKWLTSSRNTCPICRADWEYGNSEQNNRSARTAAQPQEQAANNNSNNSESGSTNDNSNND